MKNVFYYNTIIGNLAIADNGKEIIQIAYNTKLNDEYEEKETKLIKETYKQLLEYFEGKRKQFDLPLYLDGTEFQKKVWKALLNIPYGELKTYKQIAEEIGCAKGCRAVGNANNKNKIMIVIPCHRVVGTSGDLVGYACGLDVKKNLLEIEGIK